MWLSSRFVETIKQRRLLRNDAGESCHNLHVVTCARLLSFIQPTRRCYRSARSWEISTVISATYIIPTEVASAWVLRIEIRCDVFHNSRVTSFKFLYCCQEKQWVTFTKCTALVRPYQHDPVVPFAATPCLAHKSRLPPRIFGWMTLRVDSSFA